jgi:hypothetical protein
MSVIPVDFRALPHEGFHFHAELHEPQPALSAVRLGASLYVPANRPYLAAIASGR